MKLVIAAVVLTIFVVVKAELTLEQLRKIKTYRENCIQRTGVDPILVSDARRGKIADDPKLQEQLLCMFEKIGFLDQAGEIQKDVIKRKLVDVIKEEELADKLIEECVLKRSTPQLTAFESYKCFYSKTGVPVV